MTGGTAAQGGDRITLLAVYDSDSCVGRCDSQCYDAAGAGCDCVCGGANHGVGRQGAIANTLQDAYRWLDRAVEANPSILAADIMTGPGEGLSGA